MTCVCACSALLSCVPFFATPWTVVCQAPLSMGFSLRILEWVTISFSRGSFQPRDRTRVSRIGGRCFNLWATREAQFIFLNVFNLNECWLHKNILSKCYRLKFLINYLLGKNGWIIRDCTASLLWQKYVLLEGCKNMGGFFFLQSALVWEIIVL